MNNSGKKIFLASLDSKSCETQLYDIIKGLGYETIQLKESELYDLDVDRFRDPLVLFLGKRKICERKLRSALKNKKFHYLAIAKPENAQVDEEIIQVCPEFLLWPSHTDELKLRLDRLFLGLKEQIDAGTMENNLLDERFTKLNLIGSSPIFIDLLKFVLKVSRCDASVLIEGETGTGKEMVARAIHYLSQRHDFPFIPVNCGALPDNLVENELFGHDKGAYTDAQSSEPGLVHLASGGTLFLDEVEVLSSKGQVALLRFLQDHKYKPLGGQTEKKADLRIIAASNTDLELCVQKGLFRQDLLFRLNIMNLRMPPLRERTGDIDLLAHYFLKQYRVKYNQPEKFFHPSTMKQLNEFYWPGNVRELENLIHREFLLAEGPAIHIDGYSYQHTNREDGNLQNHGSGFLDIHFNQAKAQVITEFEKKFLSQLMVECKGNVTLAAKRVGKERRSLGKLLKKHGINRTGDMPHSP
jgi:DNA-binding NtrC family response regulator